MHPVGNAWRAGHCDTHPQPKRPNPFAPFVTTRPPPLQPPRQSLGFDAAEVDGLEAARHEQLGAARAAKDTVEQLAAQVGGDGAPNAARKDRVRPARRTLMPAGMLL